jgi:hypothetical protein
MVAKAQARMRQAYTEACVAFPRMNVTPIQLAFYQTYQDVAYFVGSTYVLMDPAIGGEILRMTERAGKELLAKQETERALATVSVSEHKKYRGMLSGIGASNAYILMGMIRDGATQLHAKSVRVNMLNARRNILANDITLAAIAAAEERFKTFPHGEEVTGHAEFDAQ